MGMSSFSTTHKLQTFQPNIPVPQQQKYPRLHKTHKWKWVFLEGIEVYTQDGINEVKGENVD